VSASVAAKPTHRPATPDTSVASTVALTTVSVCTAAGPGCATRAGAVSGAGAAAVSAAAATPAAVASTTNGMRPRTGCPSRPATCQTIS
jgi:hypothetical protein